MSFCDQVCGLLGWEQSQPHNPIRIKKAIAYIPEPITECYAISINGEPCYAESEIKETKNKKEKVLIDKTTQNPMKGSLHETRHASTVGIIFAEDKSDNVNYLYISHNNYTATERYGNFVKLGTEVEERYWIHSKLVSHPNITINTRAADMPLPHSEIAAIQHVCDCVNPINAFELNNESYLRILLKQHTGKKLYIVIKNSKNPPCDNKEEWGKGIGCSFYLQNLANKIFTIYGNCNISWWSGIIHRKVVWGK